MRSTLAGSFKRSCFFGISFLFITLLYHHGLSLKVETPMESSSHCVFNKTESSTKETCPRSNPSAVVASQIEVGKKSSVLKIAPQIRENSRNNKDDEEFFEVTRLLLDGLPTQKTLIGITDDEAHGTPAVILQAGLDLGKIAEQVQGNQGLIPEAIRFYTKCSQGEYLAPVRALCYYQLKKVSPKQFENGFEDPLVPNYVQYLASQL